jgi:hypothetical protein
MSQLLWLSEKAQQAADADARIARIMATVRADLRAMRTPRSKSEIVIDGWLNKVESNVGQFIDRVYFGAKKEEAID